MRAVAFEFMFATYAIRKPYIECLLCSFEHINEMSFKHWTFCSTTRTHTPEKLNLSFSRCFFTVIIYKTNCSTIWTFNYVAKSFVEFSNEVELLLVHIKLNFKVKSTLLKPSWVWKAQRSRVRACRENHELMNHPCILSIYEGRCL